MISEEIKIPEEFADVCPFSDSEFHEQMSHLVEVPMFKSVVEYAMPGIDFESLKNKLLAIRTKDEFQIQIMKPFLEMLVKKTTTGLTLGGVENYELDKSYTFISNHRDIVLDASFLNLCLVSNNRPTSEVAIGNNLLIYDWISILVRLNKSFIVKRDLSSHQRLEGALQLSNYVHFAITQKHESVWIAQREGRAKDSDDQTQESLLKMLGMGGDGGSFYNRLKELNLLPLSISYEYDPNDYLKAKEFLMKKKDPSFKKSQNDDLTSMRIGITGYMGHVHFEIAPCVSIKMDELSPDASRADVVAFVKNEVDKSIHRSYRIYPCNYIAYDILNGDNAYAGKSYTEVDKISFMQYVEKQLDKVDITVDEEDRAYMREMVYVMYSNPLKNKLNAEGVK